MALQLIKPHPRQSQETQLHISYSQIFTYTLCPMKYAHNYVWATPPESRSINMILGKAVHNAAEVFYIAFKETGKKLPVEILTKSFENSFDVEVKKSSVKIGLKKGETLQAHKDQGVELLRLFHEEIRPQEIVAVERPFSVSVPDLQNGGDHPIQLTGYFDMVESDGENTHLISELKTSSQKYSSLKLEFDLQPTVYSYAMSKLRLGTTKNSCLVRYDVLVKTKTPSFEQYFVSRTAADHERLIHLINQVLTAIEQRIFYRNLGWQCIECAFRKFCLG